MRGGGRGRTWVPSLVEDGLVTNIPTCLIAKKKKKLVFLFPGFFNLWRQLLKWISTLTAGPLFLQICCYWISYLGCYCLCDLPVSYVPLRKKKFQGQICRIYPVGPMLVSGMLTVTQIKYLLHASHCFMWRIQRFKKKKVTALMLM